MWQKLDTKRVGAMAVAVLLLLGVGQTGHAALSAVGAVDPVNGFPVSYDDANALSLELCLPNLEELLAGTCLLLDADVPLADQPISFPDNYPEEAFYFGADATFSLGGGGTALLVLALEAAFANGPVAAGDQVVFGRMRVRVDAPVAGTYTVTHPYGIETFDVAVPGTRAINFTRDIALIPGDFNAALGSDIGPFLRASATPGGAPLPFADLFPGSGKLYLANPAVLTAVTGSPSGNNVFRIDGPAGADLDGLGNNVVQTDQFSLVGRVSGTVGPPPPNVPPVAANDAGAGNLNSPVVINPLANDADADGTLNPASVAIGTLPANGTVLVNAGTGAITYTPAPNFVGADSFTYTVRDNVNAFSNIATVDVTVTGTLDDMAVARAQFNTKAKKWLISGTCSGKTEVAISAGPDGTGPAIGTARVNAKGKFKFLKRKSLVVPDATNTICIRSAGGTLLMNVPVTVR